MNFFDGIADDCPLLFVINVLVSLQTQHSIPLLSLRDLLLKSIILKIYFCPLVQVDEKVSVLLMITIQSSGAQRLFGHPV